MADQNRRQGRRRFVRRFVAAGLKIILTINVSACSFAGDITATAGPALIGSAAPAGCLKMVTNHIIKKLSRAHIYCLAAIRLIYSISFNISSIILSPLCQKAGESRSIPNGFSSS
jgi:hypothetical protein